MNIAAFQGVPGAFSEEAAFVLCGEECAVMPCRKFQDVIDAVLAGRAMFGVLPVENSSIGAIHSSLEALEGSPLHIAREATLPIHHCLLVLPGVGLADITKVLSHPAALGQCRRFFEEHPHIEEREWFDTAGAARDVAAGADRTVAAIAPRRAAARYRLEVLLDSMEDSPDNRTRFVMVARDPSSYVAGQ